MPTIIDATVVNQAYDTSGNGGHNLVRLSNGTLVALVKDTASYYYRLYKSTDGQTWSSLANDGAWSSAMGDAAIATNGTYIYLLRATSASQLQFIVYREDGTYFGGNILDTGQNAIGNVSLTINEDGTELHAAWASKNSTYPNSFNIRYAKGTINADGSVTWGAVEQVTTMNNSSYPNFAINPSIIVLNNVPLIVFEQKSASLSANTFNNQESITVVKKDSSLITGNQYVHSNWSYKNIYQVSIYSQSSPSACVAPNGRIWVAWYGYDSTDTTRYNIRVSYSDDGGVTWSAMQKLTNGNTYHQLKPSITVDKNNNVYVVWSGTHASSTTYYQIRKIKWDGSTWGSIVNVTSNTTADATNPSTLYDTTINVLEPLFIYQNVQTLKVGFYGTWTVTTISVTPGYIGQKTSSDKSNILTYSITTDGEMSDIIEKINDVTIATRTNPTSGQEFTVSLTQEQWDAIKYGNTHTLTIEMGSDTWIYTFDKRLNANDDILSAVKGVHDLQDHLNAIKAQLASAIRSKGGTVNDTDAWSAFVSAVNNLDSKRRAAGITTSSATTINFYNSQGNSSTSYYVQVTGLTFMPSVIILTRNSGSTIGYPRVAVDKTAPLVGGYTLINRNGSFFRLDGVSAYIDSSSFRLPYENGSESVYWIAYE